MHEGEFDLGVSDVELYIGGNEQAPFVGMGDFNARIHYWLDEHDDVKWEVTFWHFASGSRFPIAVVDDRIGEGHEFVMWNLRRVEKDGNFADRVQAEIDLRLPAIDTNKEHRMSQREFV
jgi:hypothetical protein